MKLKRILGTIVCVAALVCGTTSVFAAGETFEIGTPIDLTTLSEVTELEAGQVIAFPVDIITDKGEFVSMGYATTCDTNILTPGIKDADLTDAQYDNASSLGEILTDGADSSVDMAIFAIGELDRKGNFTSYGSPGVTVGKINWYDSYARTLNADAPEFYLIYTVNKSVSLDDLNVELIAPRDGCVVGIENVGSTLEKTPNTAKANACDGAFKIVVDGSSLPYWVQGVKVNDISLDACITADGSTEYSFPVRLIKSNADNTATTTEVTITATVTDDEAGTVNERTVTWGTVSVNVEGTATGYTTADSLTFAE